MNNQQFESVWDALEDTPEDAQNMRLRSELMASLQAYARALDTSPAEVAGRLGVTGPRLDDLLRGRIDKFSLETLVTLLCRAGKQVSLQIRDAA